MAGVLIKRPCYYRGKDQSDVFTGQATPRIASKHQKLGEGHGTDCPSGTVEGTNVANTVYFKLMAS